MYWSFTFTDFGYFQRLSAVVPYGFCSAETFQKLTLASPKAFLVLNLNEQLFFLTFLQSCKGIWQTLLMTLFCFHGRAGVIWNMHNVIRIVTFFKKSLDNNLNFAQNCKRTYDSQSYWWITEQLGLRLPGITPVALSPASWILTRDPEAQFQSRVKSFCLGTRVAGQFLHELFVCRQRWLSMQLNLEVFC